MNALNTWSNKLQRNLCLSDNSPQLFLLNHIRDSIYLSIFMVPTHFCTECGVEQAPLLHAGHGSVSHSLAALLYFLLARPALKGSCGWGIREDAGRPVAIGLGQELITGTRFRLLQLHVQAMFLLSTATWAEYRQKSEGKPFTRGDLCSSSTRSTRFFILFSVFNYFSLVCQKQSPDPWI